MIFVSQFKLSGYLVGITKNTKKRVKQEDVINILVTFIVVIILIQSSFKIKKMFSKKVKQFH